MACQPCIGYLLPVNGSLGSKMLNWSAWIPFAIKIMDDLAVDFNSYKFFCNVLKNTPPRFRFFALNEAVLDLCKLLDERRNNKLALSNILGNIYLNITEDKMKQEFILFQNSIESWLCSKSEFIKILKTI